MLILVVSWFCCINVNVVLTHMGVRVNLIPLKVIDFYAIRLSCTIGLVIKSQFGVSC